MCSATRMRTLTMHRQMVFFDCERPFATLACTASICYLARGGRGTLVAARSSVPGGHWTQPSEPKQRLQLSQLSASHGTERGSAAYRLWVESEQ
jgi:hypothetical protein